MSSVTRTASVLVLLLLLGAGSVSARPDTAFGPSLRVEQGRFDPRTGSGTVLDVSQRTTEPPLARLTFVAPTGIDFAPPPPGSRVGDIAVQLVPTTGKRRTPATLSGRLASIRNVTPQPEGCVREPTATLKADLSAYGEGQPRRLTLRFFAHVNQGTTRLTVCLPKTESLPARSAFRRLVLRVDHGFPAPQPGAAVWRALFTPAGPRGGAAPRKLTTESRAVVVSPSYMTMELAGGKTTVLRNTLLTFRGELTNGSSQSRRRIRLLAGRGPGSLTVVARTTTTKIGTFAFRVRAVQSGKLVFQARAPSRPAKGRCEGREPDAPAGCTSATSAGVSSNALVITVR